MSEGFATPVPDDTYSARAVHNPSTLSSRPDSTYLGVDPAVVFTSAATPLIKPGVLVYNNGTLRINVGTQNTPVWRNITNS